MASVPNGIVVFNGPSEIDGGPIVAILTGLDRPTSNGKTGPMLQLWILPANQSPLDARKRGDIGAFCGDCPIARACYVQWEQAPTQIWKAWRAGNYPAMVWKRHKPIFEQSVIRIGAAGDPAALPYWLVAQLCETAKGHTGYTHQWMDDRFQPMRRYVMASVESDYDAYRAESMGWRYFRITPSWDPILVDGEIDCPASPRGGKVTTCAQCKLCSGIKGARAKSPNVAIVVHGKRWAERMLFGNELSPVFAQ